MGIIKGFLKSFFRVVSGFTDAVKGIVAGNLKIKDAKNFTKGSRDYQKRMKENEERTRKEQLSKNLQEIKDILSSKYKNDEDEMAM